MNGIMNVILSLSMVGSVLIIILFLTKIFYRNKFSKSWQYDLYKWLVQITLCVHWFNPFVYLVKKEVDVNCELSCDEMVIKNFDLEEKRKYGDTLLSSVMTNDNYGETIIAINLNKDAKILKERLKSIMLFNKKSKPITAITVLLTIFIISGASFKGGYSVNASIELGTSNIAKVDSNNNFSNNSSLKKDLSDFNWIDKRGIIYALNGSESALGDILPYMTDEGLEIAISTYDELYSTRIYIPNEDNSRIERHRLYVEIPKENKNTPNTIISTEEVEALGKEVMVLTGNWKNVDFLFPYIRSDIVSKIVYLYIDISQNKEQGLNDSAKYRGRGFEIYSKDNFTSSMLDQKVIEIMNNSGNWQDVQLFFKHMTPDGINKVTDIYNQKQNPTKQNNELDSNDREYLKNIHGIIDFDRLPQMSKVEVDAIAIEYIETMGRIWICI